jgi:hypothetical protein
MRRANDTHAGSWYQSKSTYDAGLHALQNLSAIRLGLRRDPTVIRRNTGLQRTFTVASAMPTSLAVRFGRPPCRR